MAKSPRNTARNVSAAAAQSTTVEQFNVAQWRLDLTAAFSGLASAATRVLHVVLEGRGKVDPDTAREAITEALIAAGMVEGSPSLKNRVSEAMAVFKAETLPAELPANLQHAAKAVRAASGIKRAPRQGATTTAPKAGDPAPLVALSKAIEQIRAMDGLSPRALELVGELADLAGDLADAVLGTAETRSKAAATSKKTA